MAGKLLPRLLDWIFEDFPYSVLAESLRMTRPVGCPPKKAIVPYETF